MQYIGFKKEKIVKFSLKVLKWNILVIKDDEEININPTKEEAKKLYDNDLMPFIKSAVKHALNPIDFCINFNLLIKRLNVCKFLKAQSPEISANWKK